MAGQLAGRAGVITGGASGLGRGIVEAFLAEGAEVAIFDRANAEAVAEEVGDGVLGLPGDVTDEQDVARAFATIAETFGRFDFLVNSAGIRHIAPFLDHPLDAWRRTLDVNLTGTMICCQQAARLMLARGGGKIVNLASVAGSMALTDRSAYCASKGGVIMLTRAIAFELAAQGISCNAIAPGVIETPLSAEYFRDERLTGKILAATPLGRWGQPPDIAAPAVFLCSAASDFVQGEVLFVDGGWNAAKGY
jgi:NAD(P)-dependent dehydrogenase (short-subunit alcohol dehydrogenase family)